MYIRPDADPAVCFLIRQIPGMRRTMATEIAAGLGHDVIRSWRYRSQPRVDHLRAALNALGLDLAIVDLATRRVVQ